MINVTQTYLPPLEEYTAKLKQLWESRWVTNNGALLLELEKAIKEYTHFNNFLYCNNGTIVLQMAIKALKLKGKVITTPFSYVATTNSLLWENIEPVFVDINENDCCINTDQIEKAIAPDVTGILATHVYGLPCNTKKIAEIAKKHSLKIIYDGAHAFGAKLDGKSLMSFGDVTTTSFHATKLFHTVEGGGIFTSDDGLHKKISLYRQFGHVYDDYLDIGINAKASEFHAAMGVCLLPKLDKMIAKRKEVCSLYDKNLSLLPIRKPVSKLDHQSNYSYYPVIFETEEQLLKTNKALKEANINARRYFWPSLNELKFIKYQKCEISESISRRVLCLPLFYEITKEQVELICNTVNKSF